MKTRDIIRILQRAGVDMIVSNWKCPDEEVKERIYS